MLVRINAFREFANAVPHSVGKGGVVQITKLLARAVVALTDGKRHKGVIRGHARAAFIVLCVEGVF